MMHAKTWRSVVAVVAVAACAGLAFAQAPDQPVAGPARERPARPERAVAAGRAASGMLLTLVGEQPAKFEVVNTAKGVDLKVTAENPEQAGALQARAEAGLMRLQEANARRRERAAEAGGPARPGRGLAALLASGDVVVTTRNTDDGVVISFTSEKPEVVQTLQEDMPQWAAGLAAAGERAREVQQRVERMREAMSLLASADVTVEVKETETGITVNVTSENPEIVKQIKEKLAAYYKDQQELARLGVGAAVRPGAAAGPAGGPAMMRIREQTREGAAR